MYIVDCATTRTGTRYSRCQRREHWHRLFVHTVDNGTHWYPRRWHRPCTGTGCHAARIIRHFRRNAHKRKFHIMLTISATICSYAYTTTHTGTRYSRGQRRQHQHGLLTTLWTMAHAGRYPRRWHRPMPAWIIMDCLRYSRHKNKTFFISSIFSKNQYWMS